MRLDYSAVKISKQTNKNIPTVKVDSKSICLSNGLVWKSNELSLNCHEVGMKALKAGQSVILLKAEIFLQEKSYAKLKKDSNWIECLK